MTITSEWLLRRLEKWPWAKRFSAREQARKTIPAPIPIQCRAISELRTTSPAKCGDGSAVNEICATTGKKIKAPSQIAIASNIRNHRKFMREW